MIAAAALIPAAPLILDSQNFYKRPPFDPRWATIWPLFKGCVITSIGLVLVMWSFRFLTPRGMIFFFGIISFSLVYAKEELVRWTLHSRLGQAQFKRRFILVGTAGELARMRQELESHAGDSVEVMAGFNLTETPMQQIVNLLHDHSVFGVILSAKHTSFEQVEYVIRACELEGVEVWLIADFFSTQISRTSLDELVGRPLLIFRTTPEASWHNLAKQLLDFLGALLLLIVLSPVFLAIAIAIKLAAPGVPDIYQGNEVWDFSLVDPDNRRPVDYDARRHALASLEHASPGELLSNWRDGRIKLFLTSRMLCFRREHFDLFARGDYTPLAASGAFPESCFAFLRRYEGKSLLVIAPRLSAKVGFPPIGELWRDTTLEYRPEQPLRDIFTGREFGARVAESLAELPFAAFASA